MTWKSELLNHLWQSTAFAAAIGLATLALRRNSPRVRYWLWLAASVKFLIPFSLIMAVGARVQLPPDTPSLHAVTVQQMSVVFSPALAAPAMPVRQSFQGMWLFAAIWAGGVLFFVGRWLQNWHSIRRAVHQSVKLPLAYSIPARSSRHLLEPGVFGLLRPVLLLPKGIERTLTEEQFDAVLAHESRHVECRDNLTAALHMVVETLFWFHPLVWWIGARLMDERERDCDEAVLRCGSQPGAYARGIVQVCQTYVESPLACASGISGSDLKKRIREIMTWRGSLPITTAGKAVLAVAAVLTISFPFALGILRAQTLPPAPALTYDAVSIHMSAPGSNNHLTGPGPQGGWRTTNTPVLDMISTAYGVQHYQILGAPGWASSQGYDVIFTPDKTEPKIGPGASLKEIQASMDRNAQRMQAVLRDRFGLVLRSETRELPIFVLTLAKGGPKLTRHDPSKPGPSMRSNEKQITGMGADIEMLANSLGILLSRPVRNETKLTGQFDFTVKADSDGPMAESLFTALTDQLGLKLNSTKGPVQVYVVEKLDPPTEN